MRGEVLEVLLVKLNSPKGTLGQIVQQTRRILRHLNLHIFKGLISNLRETKENRAIPSNIRVILKPGTHLT